MSTSNAIDAMGKTNRVRATQARSIATRSRVLDATIACLVELGYCGTTTIEVQKRAGVSRGALLHHFPSRSAMMVAAVEHLGRRRMIELHEVVTGSPPTRNRIEWAVREIWRTVDDQLFSASLQLWHAAENDPELRDALLPHERWIAGVMEAGAREMFGSHADHPRFPAVLETLLDCMRGAASRRALRRRGSDDRLLEAWIAMVEAQLLDR